MNSQDLFIVLCIVFLILMGVSIWCHPNKMKHNIPLILAYVVLILLIGTMGYTLIVEDLDKVRYDMGLIIFDNFISAGVFGFLLFAISNLWNHK